MLLTYSVKQTLLSAGLRWYRVSRWVGATLAGLLPWLVLAQQLPAPTNIATYAAADQARFRPGAVVPPALPGVSAAGARVLRPGVIVFGWLPSWIPLGYAQQLDYTLLSHVAYEGYQATEQGGLLPPPTGSAAGLAALVHKSNPRCRVLLSVGYQEPSAGGALFSDDAAPLRQALAQAVAQQVNTLQADGVNLDLGFQPQATAAPGPARPASPAERARDLRRLDKTRRALNQRRVSLQQDSSLLASTKLAFAAKVRQGQVVRPADQRAYERAMQQQQQASADFQRARQAYRQALAANQRGLTLPGATPPNRPAALLSFAQALSAALRQQNPRATLTISLPAVDSAQVYTQLPTLAPLAQAFVLKAFDYTAGRRGSPGPLAPLQPSARWGPAAVATSVGYYLGQGVPPAQLVVGLPQLGKIWPEYANPPVLPTVVAPYRYLTNQALRGRPRTSQQLDSASGSYRLQLAPLPTDTTQGSSPPVPQLAWADDSASLAAKYNWVLTTRQLGGVGVWALGFDAPDAPVWHLLRARLTILAPPPTAVDTTRAAPPGPQNDRQLLQATVRKAERLAELPLVHLLLFGLVLLLAFTWLGLVVGAVRYARQLVPFPRRLALVGGLAAGGAGLLALYVSYAGQFRPAALLVGWLAGLALVAVLALGYRAGRPAELP